MYKRKNKEKKIKENSTELQKPDVEAKVYNCNKKCDNIHIYIYTHKQNQNNPMKIKYNSLIQWTKETKIYIYQFRTKLTKAPTGEKTNKETTTTKTNKQSLKQGVNWGIKQWK